MDVADVRLSLGTISYVWGLGSVFVCLGSVDKDDDALFITGLGVGVCDNVIELEETKGAGTVHSSSSEGSCHGSYISHRLSSPTSEPLAVLVPWMCFQTGLCAPVALRQLGPGCSHSVFPNPLGPVSLFLYL